jgi:hypothetical protein
MAGAADAAMHRGGPLGMWKTIGYLSLTCGVFIGLLITLAIVGLKG